MILLKKLQKAKKGQESASGAAVLIALVGLFVVLYLLFVPPDFRESLLNENKTSTTGNTTTKPAYALLLREQPGLLSYISGTVCPNNECEHPLPSFSLYRTVTPTQIASFNPFIVKNNIFVKEPKTMQFEVLALANTDNYLLTFGAKTSKGVLKIVLNGRTIFEQQLDQYNVEPIKIPKNLIKEINTLEVSVSGVGAKFWETNQYAIENMKIIADVTDTTKETNSQMFFISEDEYTALSTAKLRFVAECDKSKVGPLKIMLNGQKIFEGVPDCGMMQTIDLMKAALSKYENTIQFQSTMGNYIIDRIMLRTYLQKTSYPTYYFDLTNDQLKHLLQNKTDLNLTLDFAKRPSDDFDVIMHINGYTRTLRADKQKTKVERKIPVHTLKDKNNWIMIEPDSRSITLAELKLEIKVKKK
ncbi:MAG: hypothetical protein QW594_01215 [Candidatus Woesearchaeota archaeon]